MSGTVHAVWLADDSELHEQLTDEYSEAESKSSVMRDALDRAFDRRAAYDVQVTLTPFQARVVGNRLWRAANELRDEKPADETRWLARRIHSQALDADDTNEVATPSGEVASQSESASHTPMVELLLSEYEARVVANRLHKAVHAYDDEHVSPETALLRDIFRDETATR